MCIDRTRKQKFRFKVQIKYKRKGISQFMRP